jgi:hypothetical protein
VFLIRAWKYIFSPKGEGGLGFRKLQATNQGLILMAAWRITGRGEAIINILWCQNNKQHKLTPIF